MVKAKCMLRKLIWILRGRPHWNQLRLRTDEPVQKEGYIDAKPTPPYVLCLSYNYDGGLSFGVLEYSGEYAGRYMMGDGDLLTVEDLSEHEPVYLGDRDVCNGLFQYIKSKATNP